MKRIHYLLLGLLVSLTIAAVSPTLPPTRIAPGTGITVVTNGVNNFTLSAGSSVTNLGNGANTVLLTNAIAYSSSGTNAALIVNTNQLVVTNGNVGIATASPNGRLHVVGATLTYSSENAYPLWLSDTGNANKALLAGYDLAVDAAVIQGVHKSSAWKNLLLNPNAGNVGIGTTSPGSRLQVAGTGLTVGSAGTAITNIVSATATLNFGNILAAASEDLTITVTGAVVNDPVILGPPATVLSGAIFNAWVSAANTVKVRCNNAGSIAIDPASAVYRVTVISH